MRNALVAQETRNFFQQEASGVEGDEDFRSQCLGFWLARFAEYQFRDCVSALMEQLLEALDDGEAGSY